jgi:hypothetical protein
MHHLRILVQKQLETSIKLKLLGRFGGNELPWHVTLHSHPIAISPE